MFKNYINNVGKTKKKDTNTILTESTKGTMVGAMVGAGVGLFIGFGRKQNLLLSAFIGSVIGASISQVFINKK
jgi:uncharacterized membrane protein YeaQ/YmgE (transglycosylase-associated protein family)